MSDRAQAWQQIVDDCAVEVPGAVDLFLRIWDQGRLNYSGLAVVGGGIDELSSRLSVSALKRGAQVLVALPDENPRRPAVIFASVLLTAAIDTLTSKAMGATIALFGSSVAIRKQLAQTRVQQLQLSSVFPQVQLHEDATPVINAADQFAMLARYLPKVVVVISPISAEKILERYRPQCIALECHQESDLQWLGQVIKWAALKRVPVVGWITGDRAPVVAGARKAHVDVFQWPILASHARRADRDVPVSGDYIVENEQSLVVRPLIVQAPNGNKLAEAMAGANASLAKCYSFSRSRPAEDCLMLAWRYLRTLEFLMVPIRFYEEECHGFWGLRGLDELRTVVQRFLSVISHSDAECAKLIEAALHEGEVASELMNSSGVGLWEALRQECIAGSSVAQPTELLFLSASRRRLFELALLGLDGISQGDLREVGIRTRDLQQLRRSSEDGASGEGMRLFSTGEETTPSRLLIPGLPNATQMGILHAKATQPAVDVVVYPHQLRQLEARVRAYADGVAIDAKEQARALRVCGAQNGFDQAIPLVSGIELREGEVIALSGVRTADGSLESKQEWTFSFAGVGAAELLGDEDEEGATEETQSGGEEQAARDDIAVEKAIEIEITGGRKGLFSSDYRFNVVRLVDGRESIVERTVRSLRQGDRLVLVHGQRRQSLYELLLGRVHRHPSLQLHLAVIKAWQDEVATSMPLWFKARGMSFSQLLSALQMLGSRIQSTLTLRFWSEGKVLCPLDAQDLPRIASILEMPFTKAHHGRVAKAAERLRGLHRGLALRLAHWLRREAAGAGHEGDDEVIDAELGLTLRDFKDSLEVVSIQRIESREGLFLTSSLNLFGGA